MGAPTKANVDEILRIDREFAASASKHAAAEFDDVRTWVDARGYRLSDRVWQARQDVRRQIDVTLQQAVANRTDALVVAKQLEQHLNPSYALLRGPDGKILKNQPKGIVTKAPGRGGQGSYAARRLARTEISRAHAQATQKAAGLTPFAKGWQWNTSTQHPAPDECDNNAERDDGLGPGVYPPRGGPRMPAHPHCLCFATIALPDDLDQVYADLMHEYHLNDDLLTPVGTMSGPSLDTSLFETAIELEEPGFNLKTFYDAYSQIDKDATLEQQRAVKHYVGAGYRYLNRFLAGDVDRIPTDRLARVISDKDRIDELFKHKDAVLPHDTRLFRGTEFSRGIPSHILNAEPGDVFEDIRFGSFSLSEFEARDFLGAPKKSVMYEVVAPKGTRSLAGEILGESVEDNLELEVLLNRGYRIRVVDRSVDHDGVLRILGEILPEEAEIIPSAPIDVGGVFKPARTVDAAIKEAQKYNIELRELTKADLDIFNYYGPRMEELYRRGALGGNPRVLRFYTGRPDAGAMAHDAATDIISVNRYFKKLLTGDEEAWLDVKFTRYDSKFFTGNDATSILAHEVGHQNHWRTILDEEAWKKISRGQFDEEVADIARRTISVYAGQNQAEFVAEMYVKMLEEGSEYISPRLLEAYRDLKGPLIDEIGGLSGPDTQFIRHEFERLFREEMDEGLIPIKSLFKDASALEYDTWRPQGKIVSNIQGIAENSGTRWLHDPDAFPIQRITLDPTKITASQLEVDPFAIRNIADNWDPDLAKALVIKHGDEYLVVEGHHTIIAAMLRGEQTLSISVLDVTPEVVETVIGKFPTTIQEFHALDFKGYVTASGDLSKGKRYLEQVRVQLKKDLAEKFPYQVDRINENVEAVYLQKRKELASDYRKWLKTKKIDELLEKPVKPPPIQDDLDKAARAAKRKAAHDARKAKRAEEALKPGEQTLEQAQKEIDAAAKEKKKFEDQFRRPGESDLMYQARLKIARGIHSEQEVRDIGRLMADEVERRMAASGEEFRAGIRKRIAALEKQVEDPKITGPKLDRLREELSNLNDTLRRARFGEVRPSDVIKKELAELMASRRLTALADFHKLNKKIKELAEELAGTGQSLYGHRRQTIIDVFRELRDEKGPATIGPPMIGYGSKEAKAIAEIVDETFRANYPATWVRQVQKRAKETSTKFQIEVDARGRGSYHHVSRTIAVAGQGDHLDMVATHELAHMLERYIPRMTELERDFFRRRTSGEVATDLGGTMKGEKTLRDNFLDPYMGKSYGTPGDWTEAYEIVTMGFDSILSTKGRWNVDLARDREYYYFILGLLGGL